MILKPMGKPGVCPKHVRPWTPEEDELLISLHGKKTTAEIVPLLPAPGRTKGAIQKRMDALLARYPDRMSRIRRLYTPKEDNFIRKNCHTMTAAEIATHLDDRSMSSVHERARAIGVSLAKFGEQHPKARYPDELVIRVQDWRDDLSLTFKEIGRRLNIPGSTAWSLYNRLTADYASVREYMPR
ncbi:TPA: SANT/Myb-like DNA-binding domain-containing protein [Salmonella enterica]|uniref:SANT/Myb-like DNA-binding domain-containing protein n=1 Tax=Salmonella sp. SG203 TaxID=2555397 RepID=UPI0015828723|nr:SANT/Myb-like DNA-binding domain-containing protein [Salmonella sp. SG203]